MEPDLFAGDEGFQSMKLGAELNCDTSEPMSKDVVDAFEAEAGSRSADAPPTMVVGGGKSMSGA